jgi:hypothetical protein
VKKFIIWLFNLDDLKSLYVTERIKQKKRDDTERNDIIRELKNDHDREIARLNQTHEAEVAMYLSTLKEWKRRERDLRNREYSVKNHEKENAQNTAMLYSHVKNVADILQKEAAEIMGPVDMCNDKTMQIMGLK